jgi:hypothetical protein
LSLTTGGENRRDEISGLGGGRDFWKFDAQDLAGNLRMACSDSHNRTLAINSNPLVAWRISPILWHIVGCHQKKRIWPVAGTRLRKLSSAELSFSSPTRNANRVIESSSMKPRPLATDYDAATLIASEVGRAGRSGLIESPDYSDPGGDTLEKASQ